MSEEPIRVQLTRHYAEMYSPHLALQMALKAEELYLAASQELDVENQKMRAELVKLRAELEAKTEVARSNKRHVEAVAQEIEKAAAELVERGDEIVRLRAELAEARDLLQAAIRYGNVPASIRSAANEPEPRAPHRYGIEQRCEPVNVDHFGVRDGTTKPRANVGRAANGTVTTAAGRASGKGRYRRPEPRTVTGPASTHARTGVGVRLSRGFGGTIASHPRSLSRSVCPSRPVGV